MTDVCGYPDCLAPARYQCDHCNTPFCDAHGTHGGDREGDESRLAEAVPSQCWACGGLNADED